jgi:hypothetical protein
VPKRKPSRSRRKAGRRQPPPRVADASTRPTAAPEPPRERPTSRVPTRDYSYVRREIQRIALLAAAILIVIVVLSFFLP